MQKIQLRNYWQKLKKVIKPTLKKLQPFGQFCQKWLQISWKKTKDFTTKIIWPRLKALPTWAQITALGLVGLSLGLSVMLVVNKKSEEKISGPEFKRQLFGPYAYASKAGPLTTKLGHDAEGVKLSVENDSSQIEFKTPLTKISREKQDEQLVFETENKLIRVSYQPLKNGVKEEIILSADPNTNQFASTLSVKGVEPRVTAEGQIIFVNSEGDYQYHLQEPWAKDSTGDVTYGLTYKIYQRESQDKELTQKTLLSPLLATNNKGETTTKASDYENTYLNPSTDPLTGDINYSRELLGGINQAQEGLIKSKDYVLVLEVSPEWLNDPTRQYPIIIDPTVVHDESSEFSSGELDRVTDTGSGSSPQLESYYQELPADEHTVALYHMNEGSGTSTDDASINNYTGNLQGTPSWTTGRINNGISFAASSDYLDPTTDIELSETWTIETWFKYPLEESTHWRTLTRGTSDHQVIVQSGAYDLGTYDNTGGTGFKDSGYDINVLSDGWHYLAAVQDGVNINFYIDGKLVGQIANYISTGDITAIGNYQNGGQEWGTLDEFRVSDVARTPEEIRAAAQRRPSAVYTSDVIDLTNVYAWNDLSWTENGVLTGDGETLADSTDLVAHWKFNETSGTTADNAAGSCGTNCDGTLTNFSNTTGQDVVAGSGWTSDNGRWPSSSPAALMFDGMDDYVSISDDDTLSFENETFSIETWINTSTDKSAGHETVISKGNTSNWEYALWFLTSTPNQISFSLWPADGSSDDRVSSGVTLNDGQWHHVVAVADGTNLELYVDGIIRNSTSITQSTSNGTSNLNMGRRPDDDFYYDGTIDSVRIYSRALSADEILTNYNSSNLQFQTRVGNDTSPDDGDWTDWSPASSETQIQSFDSDAANWSWDNTASEAPTTQSDDSTTKIENSGSLKMTNGTLQVDANTVALYHFEETSGDLAGNDVFDATSNNNDGEFNGTGVATGVVDGVAGKAREFNGIDDYVNFPYSFSSPNTLTISAWIKTTSSTRGGIFGQGNQEPTTAPTAYVPTLLIQTNGKIRAEYWTGSVGAITSTNAVNDGKWHYIAFTGNGASQELFIDGVSNGTRAGTIDNSWWTKSYIGTGYDNTSRGGSSSQYIYFNGTIDEVRISNVARTPEEIAEAYRMGRDHYLNRTISSTDLSTKQSLPFYVAADQPGTHLQATAGESAYANYQPDSNTVGLWHLDEQAAIGQSCKSILDSGGSRGDGIYFIDPDGTGTTYSPFNVYCDMTTDGGGWTLIGKGREGWNWNNAGQGTLSDLATNSDGTSVSYMPSTTVDAIAKANINSLTTSVRIYRYGTNQDWRFSYPTMTSWDWVMDTSKTANVLSRSPTCTGTTTGNTNDTYWCGGANDCNRIFTWAWSGHNNVRGWSSGSTCSCTAYGSDGWCYSTEGHVILRTKVWIREDVSYKENVLIKDSSENSNTGLLSGTTYTEGKLGKARSFNGSSDLIDTGITIIPTNNFTYSMWVNPGSTQVTYADIFGNHSGSNGIVMQQNVDATNQYYASGTEGETFQLTANKWQHLVYTKSSSNGVRIYINGLKVLDNPTGTAPLTQYSAYTLKIGQGYAGGGRYFNGLIDEFRIDDTIRTPEEIRQAYEVGQRTHPITIDFAASLDNGNLIANSGDTSFTVDATDYGLSEMGSNLYLGDKLIVKENYGGTEYIAQGTVTSVTPSTGAVTVSSWDTGSTFPGSGFTANASVFKWQREYFDLSGALDSHIDAVTNLTLRFTNGHEGRTVYLDDLRSAGDYLTTSGGSTITSPTDYRYLQYRAILTSSDPSVSASFDSVTLDYEANTAPTAPTSLLAEGQTNPTGVADTTPEFSAVYNDSNTSDIANKYQIQVDDNSDFSSVIWDSGASGTSMSNCSEGSRCQDISYAGSSLSWGTTYYWRIKFWDQDDYEGAWSVESASFTMSQIPNTPTLDSPTNDAIGQSIVLTLQTTATDGDSDYLQYKIELCEDEAMTSNCQTYDQTSSQTGWSGQDAGAGTAYTSGTQASYTLQSALTSDATFFWRSYALDPAGTNTWSSTQATPYSFKTEVISQAATCTLEEARDDSSITINWSDTSDIEEGYEIKRSVNGGAFTTLTTKAADSTSHADDTISQGNTYQYQVAPYRSGPEYGEWCTTATLSIQSGVFSFENLQFR